jgi:2,3-bisphosphoglycerate-independent phosphoglycerate mutase
MAHKTALIILDGWGIGDRTRSDAIYQAKTPFMDQLIANNPFATLTTHGEAVGLPNGQMGNSEVGHLNLGAGRVVFQELTRINRSIEDGSFFENSVLLDALNYAREKDVKVHLLGLVSHGGVHSAFEHLEALIKLCATKGMQRTFVHAITDGRDCSPKTAIKDLRKLRELETEPLKLASIIGRYYAMDRDNRWERIAKAYDLFVHGKGNKTDNPLELIEQYYQQGITDEFLPGIVIAPEGIMEEGDVVISFNFRTDRPREITQALTQKAFPEFGMAPLRLRYLTMTPYDATFKNVQVIFDKDALNNTLGETLSYAGVSQVRIAETEKYPHVTYFFNGGREIPFPLEHRIMVPSPKVATYDLQPEMSAPEVTNQLLSYVIDHFPKFICLNYANPDMVGHTGNYGAIVKAVETIDRELERLVSNLVSFDYRLIILADHGNADVAENPDGTPNTAHSLNPVPCILVNSSFKDIKPGILADIAPTLLEIMGLSIPFEMTGNSLIKKGA